MTRRLKEQKDNNYRNDVVKSKNTCKQNEEGTLMIIILSNDMDDDGL